MIEDEELIKTIEYLGSLPLEKHLEAVSVIIKFSAIYSSHFPKKGKLNDEEATDKRVARRANPVPDATRPVAVAWLVLSESLEEAVCRVPGVRYL